MMSFDPMGGQSALSAFNQPTTDLGPLMRRQRRGDFKTIIIIAESWLIIAVISWIIFFTTEMNKFNNILRADLIETPTTYEVHCGEWKNPLSQW